MERDLQIQAVVTGTRRFGELHKSVTLFSPESGLINAIVFGGRKGKKTALAPLFSFGTFQLYYNPVKNEYSVTESDCTFIADKIMKDIKLTAAASYFCEVCTRIRTDSPDDVYILLTQALKKLEEGTFNSRKITTDFTWKLLILSGVGCDMTTCPSCDRHYSDDETLGFSSSMLTPVCSKCSDNESITVLPGVRRYLVHTFSMSFEEALEVQLYETALARISSVLLKWISEFCQWPLNTVKSGLL